MDMLDKNVQQGNSRRNALSLQQYFEYMKGPTVDIYVGVGEQRKHYYLPKNILCHYSRYFDRCFNGSFLEGTTQQLELPEDPIIFFETLVEYMLSGKINKALLEPKTILVLNDPSRPETGGFKDQFDHETYVETCRQFLLYGDKYELGAIASDIVCQPWGTIWGLAPGINNITCEEQVTELSKKMAGCGGYDRIPIRGVDIETVYAVAPKTHALRRMALLAAFYENIDREEEKDDSIALKKDAPFCKQEKETPGFALDMLEVIRHQGLRDITEDDISFIRGCTM